MKKAIQLLVLSVFPIILLIILPKDLSHSLQEEIQPVEKIDESKLVPELVPVCACESMGNPTATPQQFNEDGSIKYYMGNYGMCQINQVHIPEATSMGIDIMTPSGNIEFANILYQRRGLQPWRTWSGHCWEKYLQENPNGVQ